MELLNSLFCGDSREQLVVNSVFCGGGALAALPFCGGSWEQLVVNSIFCGGVLAALPAEC